MFFKKTIAKNCYLCINEVLFIYGTFLGLSPINYSCKHKSNKNSYTIKRSVLYETITFSINIMLFITNSIHVYGLIMSDDTGIIYYCKNGIYICMGYIFCGNLVLFLSNMKYRRKQLEDVMYLLNNTKLFGLDTLISYERALKLRKTSIISFFKILFTILFLLTFSIYDLKIFSIIEILHRCLMILCVISFSLFFETYSIESSTYRELMATCYAKIKNVLRNRNDYKVRNVKYIKLTNFDRNNSRYANLVEQLNNLRKLHIIIIDNLNLFNKFLIPTCTFDVPCFIGVLILMMYTSIKMVMQEQTFKFDSHFSMLLSITYLSLINLISTLMYVDMLKKPVSYFKLFSLPRLRFYCYCVLEKKIVLLKIHYELLQIYTVSTT